MPQRLRGSRVSCHGYCRETRVFFFKIRTLEAKKFQWSIILGIWEVLIYSGNGSPGIFLYQNFPSYNSSVCEFSLLGFSFTRNPWIISANTVLYCHSFTNCCRLPQIYEEFYHTVNNADHEKDLRLWSNTHGVNMAMNWPQFEVSTLNFHS